MVNQRTREPRGPGPGGHGGRRRRRWQRGQARRAWRRVMDGAAAVVDGIAGSISPAPRPAVVPVPVRSTRPLRRGT